MGCRKRYEGQQDKGPMGGGFNQKLKDQNQHQQQDKHSNQFMKGNKARRAATPSSFSTIIQVYKWRKPPNTTNAAFVLESKL